MAERDAAAAGSSSRSGAGAIAANMDMAAYMAGRRTPSHFARQAPWAKVRVAFMQRHVQRQSKLSVCPRPLAHWAGCMVACAVLQKTNTCLFLYVYVHAALQPRHIDGHRYLLMMMQGSFNAHVMAYRVMQLLGD